MAHYAKVESGLVTQVIAAELGFFDTFIDSSPGEWIQTSYNTIGGIHLLGNTPLRKNHAAIGSVYDSTRDAFYASQPYPSWTLVEDTCLWQPPTVYPDDGKDYEWNEASTNWVEVT
jgi:hypothetical protein